MATLFTALKQAGIKQQDMSAMLGQVTAAGDIGAFGPKDMAKHLPPLLGMVRRLGMQGPEAIRFLGASLQAQYHQTQDSAAAATNMENLLNAVISSTSQERFAKEGYDLASSITAALNNGKADNPVEAFILLSEQLVKKQNPAKAKKIEALKAKIKQAKEGSAEEDQAVVALLEASGLSSIVSNKKASAGLAAQIRYGNEIKNNIASIKGTDGQAKIEKDAKDARDASKLRWGSVAASMQASMISIGDALRPLTDSVADGLTVIGNGLASLTDKYPAVVRGMTLMAAGVVALGAAVSAFKVGKGLLNVGRGTLMGDPNKVQKVLVTNPGTAGVGGGDSQGRGKRKRRGKGGRGTAAAPGSRTPSVPSPAAGAGAGSIGRVAKGMQFVKGVGVVPVVAGSLLQAHDIYDKGDTLTRDEKAEGYGIAAGNLAGGIAGAAAGAALGSFVPIVGTLIGGIIGGALGAWGGGALGGSVSKAAFGEPTQQPASGSVPYGTGMIPTYPRVPTLNEFAKPLVTPLVLKMPDTGADVRPQQPSPLQLAAQPVVTPLVPKPPEASDTYGGSQQPSPLIFSAQPLDTQRMPQAAAARRTDVSSEQSAPLIWPAQPLVTPLVLKVPDARANVQPGPTPQTPAAPQLGGAVQPVVVPPAIVNVSTAPENGKTPKLGDVPRSLVMPVPKAPVTPLANVAVPGKTAAPRIDQKLTFAPRIPVTVQGDVKDPRRIAQELFPHLQGMFEDFVKDIERRNLFDAPHL